jgi:hypothetical protein
LIKQWLDGNVDNTSDVNKPSTATQNALDLKQNLAKHLQELFRELIKQWLVSNVTIQVMPTNQFLIQLKQH